MILNFSNTYGNKTTEIETQKVDIKRICQITNYKNKKANELIKGDLTVNSGRGVSSILEGRNNYRHDSTVEMNANKFSVFTKIIGMDGNQNDLTQIDIANAHRDYISNKSIWKKLGVNYFGYDPNAAVARLEIKNGGTLRIDFETEKERQNNYNNHLYELNSGSYWENRGICPMYKKQEKPNRGFKEFADALAQRESRSNYKIMNRYGYAGRYQFGETALADAQFYNMPAKKEKLNSWNGSFTELAKECGVKTIQDFLKNPQAQDIAFKKYKQRQLKAIKSYDLEKYIGMYLKDCVVTESGLLAGAHLKGPKNVKRFLERGIDSTDAFGTHISEYIRNFANYDMSELYTD